MMRTLLIDRRDAFPLDGRVWSRRHVPATLLRQCHAADEKGARDVRDGDPSRAQGGAKVFARRKACQGIGSTTTLKKRCPFV